ncbi:hypothetical protein GGQ84_001955 [Desulfitispora alkaliphila]|uniref:hypothetical protein n=1 Tax=Desulfitispora alkaliphila TaxID=622674 RepID=UPI003D257DE3
MKKKLFIIVAFIVIGTAPFYLWQIKQPHTLDVFIFNQATIENSYREHNGLTWVLNQSQYQVDVGAELPATLELYDLIYIADTYGGLQADELEKIKKSLWSGTTLIAEHNTCGSLNHLLGLEWTGWIGRFFVDLDRTGEVPKWAIESYEKQGKEWEYSGSGFLFANNEDKVIVLDDPIYATTKGIKFSLTDAGQGLMKSGRNINYNYWFNIVEPLEDTKILGEYHLSITEKGKENLEENGIPATFPAIIKNPAGLYETYYFAGSFARMLSTPSFYQAKGIHHIQRLFTSNTVLSEDVFYWRAYVPMMKSLLDDIALGEGYNVAVEPDLYKADEVELLARTNQELIEIYIEGEWREMPILGMNIGMAKPGKWFTEFPEAEETYTRWFKRISEMNANTIRVYTLQHPSFYRALLKFNVQNQENPIYLMQEIWPEEHPPDDNLLGRQYQKEFLREIELVIDAIHGNAVIPERRGRAWGDFYADVSPYTIAYLVGREFEPEEVISTDELNSGFTFESDYLSMLNGSPTDAWFAKNCSYVLEYEEAQYNRQTPVAIVSWPTLDPMEHPAEWNEQGDKSLEYNDKVSIDIRNITVGEKTKAGFFGAYHIYPNYPDFMNNEPSYASYRDEQGEFRYGGYLQHFLEYHQGYPALVAEFGLATGMGNAHSNPNNYHHGSMTEEEQGKGVVRMMEAIFNEGYMGGVIFEWMDEWAKKTWTTEPFMVPYEHNVFWHNAIDPEQNYGIMANEATKPKEPELTLQPIDATAKPIIHKVELRANETFFFIDILLDEKFNFNEHEVLIGIDTYGRNKGEFYFSQDLDIEAPSGMEFLVELLGKDKARLLVTPSYNSSNMAFSSTYSRDAVFELIQPLINKERVTKGGTRIEAIYEDASKLKYGDQIGSTNYWLYQNNEINLRLPWGRISVTDPTTHRILDDPREYNYYPERDTFHTNTTEGFLVYLMVINKRDGEILQKLFQNPEKPYLWESWGEPRYRERLKDSYYYIQEYFSTFN